MKTSELTGALLADWVAMANGWTLQDGDGGQGIWNDGTGPFVLRRRWKPHEDWAHGGLIIERERIHIAPLSQHESLGELKGMWTAKARPASPYAELQYAATPLIAAMRAYVVSKFGDDVPDATA